MPSMATSVPLILASTSPYRRALLEKLGIPFDVVAPDVDETPLASRLALEKARAVASHSPRGLVIGSDQVAMLNDIRLSKPHTRENAIAQLRRASGQTVVFYTALCVIDAETDESKSGLDVCQVVFRELTDAQIERYVDREQPLNCAGSFKSEGLGIALLEKIETVDPNALVGLPLILLVRLLKAFGVSIL